VVAVWVITWGIAYAERQHLYVNQLLGPLTIGVLTLVIARRTVLRRALFSILAVAVVISAHLTSHLATIDMLRGMHGPLNAEMVEIREIPRAHGVYYTSSDAAIIRSVSRYVSTLKNDETFFDFTNRGALYFLLNRDCPIRQIEVPFYETEERQREVIDHLRTNPHVRAVLVPREGDTSVMIDAVPNATRAPLVWAFVQEHFRPDFEEGAVVFWRRVD